MTKSTSEATKRQEVKGLLDHVKVSIFDAPVTNIEPNRIVGWTELTELFKEPTVLPDKSKRTKEEHGKYYTRGIIDGTRRDANLRECTLLIIDVDKPEDKLPTVHEIHDALGDITHAVYTSVTPGRSRIVIPVKTYYKEDTNRLTRKAYLYCLSVGLEFDYAWESKTQSQPWFYSQTLDPDQHVCLVNNDGELFDPDSVEDEPEPTETTKPDKAEPGEDPLQRFIKALQSGTLHEAAKGYAGWMFKTSNLTPKQIFDNLTTLVENYCTDQVKVARWHTRERTELEKWFGENVKDKAKPGSEELRKRREEENRQTHMELADSFIAQKYPQRDKVVGCQGSIWQYNHDTGLWEGEHPDNVALDVGAAFPDESRCARVPDYKSIAGLVCKKLEQADFFDDAPVGLPCASHFYQVKDHSIQKINYTPELKQRYKNHFDPVNEKPARFMQLLQESFDGCHTQAQIDSMQEVFGGLLTGSWFRTQKAILNHGVGQNGKSVIMAILEGLFPVESKVTLSPQHFGDLRMVGSLAGKLINTVGELSATKHLNEQFKKIIGADTTVESRPVFGHPFEFRPIAGHIFNCNRLPPTDDAVLGFFRRWTLFHYPNIVPDHKQNPYLAEEILADEIPQILAWALSGAQRLAKNKFRCSVTQAHKDLMAKWRAQVDPVYAFLNDDEYVKLGANYKDPRSAWFPAFKRYCTESNVRQMRKLDFLAALETHLSTRKYNGTMTVFGGEVIPRRK